MRIGSFVVAAVSIALALGSVASAAPLKKRQIGTWELQNRDGVCSLTKVDGDYGIYISGIRLHVFNLRGDWAERPAGEIETLNYAINDWRFGKQAVAGQHMESRMEKQPDGRQALVLDKWRAWLTPIKLEQFEAAFAGGFTLVLSQGSQTLARVDATDIGPAFAAMKACVPREK